MARRKKMSNMADQTGCRLLGLPPELRNNIYELVFSGTTHTIPSHESRINYRRMKKHPAPGLLLACKQIHVETISMFYAQTAFYIEDHWNLPLWLKKIGPIRQRQINTIHFKQPDPEYFRSYGARHDSKSQKRIRAWGAESVRNRRRLLKEIRDSDAILDSSKVFVNVSLPGTKTYWSNEPKKITQMFAEKLRETK
ncbi:hypothetical protein PRZ48_014689 [Zasmidium cellare]|uniref:Uncharacterized protein n=1 Tax=Zasmidium cellare TaxID=395010 RepID=A0ABR0DZG6_ZASCE|nr:hypothetical protein PRZ48_014689 [Zasmidium cellare]